jgi:hypothetical protein
MLLPPAYAWFEPVLFAALIVFAINVSRASAFAQNNRDVGSPWQRLGEERSGFQALAKNRPIFALALNFCDQYLAARRGEGSTRGMSIRIKRMRSDGSH